MFCKTGVLAVSQSSQETSMSESLIKKVAGHWLIKRYSDTGIFLRIVQSLDTYFEELPHVHNGSKLCNNNLLRENKPPAPTAKKR